MAHKYKKLVKGNKEIVLPESKFNFLMFLWFIPVALVWLGGFSIVMFFILVPIACLSILVIIGYTAWFFLIAKLHNANREFELLKMINDGWELVGNAPKGYNSYLLEQNGYYSGEEEIQEVNEEGVVEVTYKNSYHNLDPSLVKTRVGFKLNFVPLVITCISAMLLAMFILMWLIFGMGTEVHSDYGYIFMYPTVGQWIMQFLALVISIGTATLCIYLMVWNANALSLQKSLDKLRIIIVRFSSIICLLSLLITTTITLINAITFEAMAVIYICILQVLIITVVLSMAFAIPAVLKIKTDVYLENQS